MAATKLTPQQLKMLRPLERELISAVRDGTPERAIEVAAKIQNIFPKQRSHHRLLRAKLWAFESCLDANRLQYAQTGFIGIRKLANSDTRLYLEASSLLAICYLRNKKTATAKKIIREVVAKINNIKSDRTRRKFQKRLVERIEEECILTELVGTEETPLDVKEIEAKAILLVQRSSDDEIYKLMGNSVPTKSIALLRDVRAYSIQQLPVPDRKLLPSPETTEKSRKIGKLAYTVLTRVAWKTLCASDSPVYKLWSKQAPKVFNEGYFSAAIVTCLSSYRIGIPLIASGLAALAMKYSAETFCEMAKPKGIMISHDDKDA